MAKDEPAPEPAVAPADEAMDERPAVLEAGEEAVGEEAKEDGGGGGDDDDDDDDDDDFEVVIGSGGGAIASEPTKYRRPGSPGSQVV